MPSDQRVEFHVEAVAELEHAKGWLPYEELISLKERLQDMEDLLQLRKSKKAEGRKRVVPLARVKRQFYQAPGRDP